MIKPTRYADDGYPITWFRSHIPSNSLAVLYGLVRDCAERAILGPEVELVLSALDESNTVIRPERIIRGIRRRGNRALVMLAGVQSIAGYQARARQELIIFAEVTAAVA